MSILTHAHIHEHILTSSQPRATCGYVVVSASYEGGKPRYLKCASKDANILRLLNDAKMLTCLLNDAKMLTYYAY